MWCIYFHRICTTPEMRDNSSHFLWKYFISSGALDLPHFYLFFAYKKGTIEHFIMKSVWMEIIICWEKIPVISGCLVQDYSQRGWNFGLQIDCAGLCKTRPPTWPPINPPTRWRGMASRKSKGLPFDYRAGGQKVWVRPPAFCRCIMRPKCSHTWRSQVAPISIACARQMAGGRSGAQRPRPTPSQKAFGLPKPSGWVLGPDRPGLDQLRTHCPQGPLAPVGSECVTADTRSPA